MRVRLASASLCLALFGCADEAHRAPLLRRLEAAPRVAFAIGSSTPQERSSKAVADVLAAIPEDPPPREIIRDTHYFVSNEHGPEGFRRHIDGIGGALIGVGAEQNYLFAGWARSEALLLVDFDQWVVDVHLIHGVFMRHAPTPDAFVAAWSEEAVDDSRALLEKAFPDASTRERILEGHRIMRIGVFGKLKGLREDFRAAEIPCVLTDRAQYDHVRDLWTQGRVRPLRGDFTGQRTMKGIAAATREIEMPVRVIYVSNVEDYFNYDSGLGDNLTSQPTDAGSLLLRSVPIDGESYVYVAQRMDHFRLWLAAGAINRTDILAKAPMSLGPKGMTLPGPP